MTSIFVLIHPNGTPRMRTNMMDADEVKTLFLGETECKKWSEAEAKGWSVKEYKQV